MRRNKIARPKKDIGAAFALVAKDLLENNQNIADVGTILGALGEDSLKWLKDLKAECTTIDEFLEIATKRADIALIVAAVKCALGYEYQEEDRTYRNVLNHRDDTGAPVMKEVVDGRKVKIKRALPNDALLKFLLKCRLPEYFQDTQRIEINKKTIEIKEISHKEIESIAGRLLDTKDAKTKE